MNAFIASLLNFYCDVSGIVFNCVAAGSTPLTITSSVIKNGHILRLPTNDNG